ncbi:MAG: polysaccharide biosynthesis/export family protein [Fuerstiella sp.]
MLILLLATGCSALHQPYARTIEHKMEVLSRIPRSQFQPIDLRLLSQAPPPEHLVDDGDILGIYIEGGPGDDDGQMPVRLPDDRFVMPAIGYPIPVRNGGYIRLPQVGVVHVRGLTVWQIEDRLRKILIEEKKQIQPDDLARIHVSLMWRRAVSVMVVRQEEVSAAALMSPSNGTDADRRSGQVVELPAFQNDVLHALMMTGGLPNDQAENAVYVFKRHDRRRPGHRPSDVNSTLPSWTDSLNRPSFGAALTENANVRQAAFRQSVAPRLSTASGFGPEPVGGHSSFGLRHELNAATQQAATCPPAFPDSAHPGAVRIPLSVNAGEPLMFGQHDVVLEDGDIVLVESREADHFLTGGLLGGGQYALPRNQDLDILDAVLLADSYSRLTQLNSPTRAIGGVSVLNRDVTVGASRVIVERRLADGRTRRFRISLYAAMKNPAQRVIIEPGDRIYLEYTPVEAFFAFFERHLLDPMLTGAPAVLTD